MTKLWLCDDCGVTDEEGIATEEWRSVGRRHYCPDCSHSSPMPGGDPVQTHQGWEQQ